VTVAAAELVVLLGLLFGMGAILGR
jgi:hypothetical protein